jgi:hypothetical protein
MSNQKCSFLVRQVSTGVRNKVSMLSSRQTSFVLNSIIIGTGRISSHPLAAFRGCQDENSARQDPGVIVSDHSRVKLTIPDRLFHWRVGMLQLRMEDSVLGKPRCTKLSQVGRSFTRQLFWGIPITIISGVDFGAGKTCEFWHAVRFRHWPTS